MNASQRVQGIEPSATVMIADQARRLINEGRDVINLANGDPDFPTPPAVVDAAYRALRDGQTHYGSSRGLALLREEIARKLETEDSVQFDPNEEIIVTPGGKMALFAAVLALVDPDDEVLLLDPSWVSYEPSVRMAGGIPVRISLGRAVGAAAVGDQLAGAVTRRTKLVIVNSPNNPSGRVLTPDEIGGIAAVAQKHDLAVLSDEIYEKIVYDDVRHVSVASLPGMRDRTIVVNGFSKAFAMTGWRIGYLASERVICQQILKVQQHSATCVSPFLQHGAVAALSMGEKLIRPMIDEYANRRDYVVSALDSLPGMDCPAPEGAFYVFPDIRATGLTSVEYAASLLEAKGVAATPGVAFGESGEGHIRLSFANSMGCLEEAVRRLAEFQEELGSTR